MPKKEISKNSNFLLEFQKKILKIMNILENL